MTAQPAEVGWQKRGLTVVAALVVVAMLHTLLVLVPCESTYTGAGTTTNQSTLEASAEDGSRHCPDTTTDERATPGAYAVTLVATVVILTTVVVTAAVRTTVVITAVVLTAVMVAGMTVGTATSATAGPVIEVTVAMLVLVLGMDRGSEQQGQYSQGTTQQIFRALEH